ncbi:MAG: response regulator [Candidatus Hydrothermarchaeales archaeon]
MSKLVLVVDDEEDFLYQIKRMLERAGLNVATATSGMEALSMLKDISPDLILLDVMMPKMTGWDLAKTIKEMEGFKDATIAMLTVKSELEDKVISLEDSGAAWHITKPIEMKKFVNTVKWLLESPPK